MVIFLITISAHFDPELPITLKWKWLTLLFTQNLTTKDIFK